MPPSRAPSRLPGVATIVTDHAARLVHSRFSVRNDELHIGGVAVSEIAAQFGTPLFVYDQAIMESQVALLRETYPAKFELFYSIKANPNAAILRCFLQQGCGLEIASAGELYQALQAGCPSERVIFAGPGKTAAELDLAIQANIGELHIESIDEAVTLDALAQKQGRSMNVALRINPVDGGGGAMRMGGRSSPFGIDEEMLDDAVHQVLALRSLRLSGVHLFMGTQILDADVLLAQYERGISIARRVARQLPHPLHTIDLGGGLGIPYFANESPLDCARLAAGLREIAAQLDADALLCHARCVIEPGRYLVGEAGVYLCRVTRVKQSRGRNYAVIDGGMHHHLAASGNLGQTIKRNFPVLVANRIGSGEEIQTDVVGPLCTPLDTLARKASLPPMQAGDLFAVLQSGAYARTSSPHGFLSHDAAAEVIVHDGTARLIRRRGKPQDCLIDQVGLAATPSTANES